jgi:hypothetical protein
MIVSCRLGLRLGRARDTGPRCLRASRLRLDTRLPHMVTVTPADLVVFPALSCATAVSVCVPLVDFFVFHWVE